MGKFVLTAATLVALYGVFSIYGDEARRPEAPRASAGGSGPDFSLSDWLAPGEEIVVRQLPADAMSEREAIEVALAAGRAHRDGRSNAPLLGELIAAAEATPSQMSDALAPEMWYVTGTTVNVRAGPGTGNPVVAQVRFGDAAEVLDDSGDGWIQIRPAGSDTVGWISGRFMDQNAPG